MPGLMEKISKVANPPDFIISGRCFRKVGDNYVEEKDTAYWLYKDEQNPERFHFHSGFMPKEE